MPGDIAVPAENIKSIEKNNVTFVIPDAATEAGPIEVTTIYGDAKSGFFGHNGRAVAELHILSAERPLVFLDFTSVPSLVDKTGDAVKFK